jgi:hypothetical protein
MSKLTRRDVIDTLVVTAAAAALENPLLALAQPANQEALADRRALTQPQFKAFRDFIRISSALTGIDGDLLAPDRKPKMDQGKPVRDAAGELIPDGADPTQAVKTAYFNLATADAAYPLLLKEFQDNLAGNATPDAPTLTKAATPLLASKTDGVKELARSIIMAWYFGVWYEWRIKGEKPRFTVVSADAYTQGWVWRIAQAHPAGYSNMRFGHWAFPPPPAFDLENIMPKGEAV